MPGAKAFGLVRELRLSFLVDDEFRFNPSHRGFMNASPRAATTRISILLLVLCAVSFGWEAYRNSGLLHLSGRVVEEGRALGGKGGDNKEFTIRYRVQGEDYSLISRRGILDQLGGLRGLQRGDIVPLAVSPAPPHRAILDTLSGRYGMTLCFVALSAVFFVVAALVLSG